MTEEAAPDPRKTTSEKKTCSNCRHWCDFGKDAMNVGGPRQGQCRVNPPSLVMQMNPHDGSQVAASTWPPSTETQWCGKHQVGTPRKAEEKDDDGDDPEPNKPRLLGA